MTFDINLDLPVQPDSVPLVQAHARALGKQAGFDGERLDAIRAGL